MKIDTEHLHYWMCAIRESSDPKRTLDAFWQGQMNSKEWLIDHLKNYVHFESSFDIYGGWVGVLASMLFQSDIPVTTIRSIDIDPSCESIAATMNKKEEMQGRFNAVTADMCNEKSQADVVINTSCEHITQEQHDLWLANIPDSSLIVLQSNNYNIAEHVRISNNLEEFKQQSGLNYILYSGELDLPLYKRFMIIGYVSI
jgi:hypothetical protein